jgi:hypothetical protein
MPRHKLFRNPQGAKIYPIRDFLGSNMPSGRDGFVIEELDWNMVVPEDAQLLVVRRFGEGYGLDGTGQFLIAEFKHRPDLSTYLDEAQRRTFGLIDDQCRLGDERRAQLRHMKRYGGFYVVAYDEPQPGLSTKWCVRRVGGERTEVMAWDEFSRWLQVVHIG